MWQEIAYDDPYWEKLYALKKEFPQISNPSGGSSWREMYKRQYVRYQQTRKESGLAAVKRLLRQKWQQDISEVKEAGFPASLLYMPLIALLVIAYLVLLPMKIDSTWVLALPWIVIHILPFLALLFLSFFCLVIAFDLCSSSGDDKYVILGGILLPISGALCFVLLGLKLEFNWTGLPAAVCFVPIYLHSILAGIGCFIFLVQEGECRKWVVVGVPYGGVCLTFLLQPLLICLRAEGYLGAVTWWVFRRCRVMVFLLWSFVFWIPLVVTLVLTVLRLDGTLPVLVVYILIPAYIYAIVFFFVSFGALFSGLSDLKRNDHCCMGCCYLCACSYYCCCRGRCSRA